VTIIHPPARNSSRVGKRIQLALGAAAALAAISLSPGSAQAYVVTVLGVQYDVTTFTGTYNDNTSKFQTAANGGTMPWFGNSGLADSFAAAVASSLGMPNIYGLETLGPWFAYSANSASAWCADVNCFNGNPSVAYASFGAFTSVVYAQATLYTAPAPLPLFGAAAAFGFSRKLRKRIQLAPAALGSTMPQA
jgi:hypothetical protein